MTCYEAYENALGIRNLLFPRVVDRDALTVSNLLAVTSYDGVIRLLSPVCWRVAFVLPMVHPREMKPGFGAEEGGSSSGVVTKVEILAKDIDSDRATQTQNFGTYVLVAAL